MPISFIMGFWGYLAPQKRTLINIIFFLGVLALVFFYYYGIED